MLLSNPSGRAIADKASDGWCKNPYKRRLTKMVKHVYVNQVLNDVAAKYNVLIHVE